MCGEFFEPEWDERGVGAGGGGFFGAVEAEERAGAERQEGGAVDGLGEGLDGLEEFFVPSCAEEEVGARFDDRLGVGQVGEVFGVGSECEELERGFGVGAAGGGGGALARRHGADELGERFGARFGVFGEEGLDQAEALGGGVVQADGAEGGGGEGWALERGVGDGAGVGLEGDEGRGGTLGAVDGARVEHGQELVGAAESGEGFPCAGGRLGVGECGGEGGDRAVAGVGRRGVARGEEIGEGLDGGGAGGGVALGPADDIGRGGGCGASGGGAEEGDGDGGVGLEGECVGEAGCGFGEAHAIEDGCGFGADAGRVVGEEGGEGLGDGGADGFGVEQGALGEFEAEVAEGLGGVGEEFDDELGALGDGREEVQAGVGVGEAGVGAGEVFGDLADGDALGAEEGGLPLVGGEEARPGPPVRPGDGVLGEVDSPGLDAEGPDECGDGFGRWGWIGEEAIDDGFDGFAGGIAGDGAERGGELVDRQARGERGEGLDEGFGGGVEGFDRGEGGAAGAGGRIGLERLGDEVYCGVGAGVDEGERCGGAALLCGIGVEEGVCGRDWCGFGFEIGLYGGRGSG